MTLVPYRLLVSTDSFDYSIERRLELQLPVFWRVSVRGFYVHAKKTFALSRAIVNLLNQLIEGFKGWVLDQYFAKPKHVGLLARGRNNEREKLVVPVHRRDRGIHFYYEARCC